MRNPIGPGLVRGLFLWTLFAAASALAQNFTFEFMSGDAYNFPTPLTVHQAGYPDAQIMADYQTEPFGPYTPYYTWRAALWDGQQAWELQQVHHRLFLANPNDIIQSLAIHFGYNYFLLGHAWKIGEVILHVGAGVIICNPTDTVRGKLFQAGGTGWFDEGYQLSGVGAQVAASHDFYFAGSAYVVLDVGLMGGLASVPVVDGSADVPNLSLHGHLGMGFGL